MAAVKVDLVIEKGATYKKDFIWKDKTMTPINITGYTARMQIRKSYHSDSFEIELTTENSGIVIDGPTGKVSLYISNTGTSALSFSDGVYDLELIDVSADVIKFLRGSVSVIEEVTK